MFKKIENPIILTNDDLTGLNNFRVKVTGVKLESKYCKILKILKAIYNCEIKEGYFDLLESDLRIYGSCFQQFKKFNFFQKLIRRIKRLPLDRIRIDPTTVRYSQPNNKGESFAHKFEYKIK